MMASALLGSLRRDPVWLAWALLSLLVLGYFLLWPILGVMVDAWQDESGQFSLTGFQRFWSEASYRDALVNTLILGVAVTVTSVLLGGALAVVLARLSFPVAALIGALPLLTLVVPDVVVAASWIVVLGKQGVVNSWLSTWDVQLPSLFSWWGLIFVMTLTNYVYAFVPILAGLKSMDRSLEEAATSLGRPPLHVLLTVTQPLMLPAIGAGALIVFMHVIGDFGVPALLGAHTPVLAVKTYNEFVSEMGGSPQMQSTLATVLIMLGLLVVIVQKTVVERRQYQMESGRAPVAIRITGISAALAVTFVSSVVLVSLVPVIVVCITAFTQSVGPVLRYGSWTLKHVEYALMRAPEPLYNSLFLATIATVVGVVFSVLTAYLITKRPSWLTHCLDAVVMLPLTIAGTVLGIALINAFNSGWLVLTGTWMIMGLAYFLRRVPTSVRAAMGPMFNLKSSIEEASISLGVSPFRSFVRVVLPLVMPAVWAAAVLMWITTLSELSATVVLYFGGMNTMPIEIFQLVDSGRLAQASAYSVILLLSIFIPLLFARFVCRLKI
ncbi:ABC transporter permease [Paenalcaligenes suwonensis]|uniref:ABC transporter permease n=1 Tax=Paenalcaligenes suwonensis TaxID=1202713 RepID=UPI001F602DD8|nr:iron ABC transporter permease [Paenalcaligenes suwonensis]